MPTARLLCMIAVCLMASTAWAQQADEADPREKLTTAIPEAIKLIEKKEYETLLKKFVSPDDLKQITETKPLPDLAKDFGQRNATTLLKVLKMIKDKEPKLEDDGKTAVYEFKEAIEGKMDIRFLRIDKFWYIKN